MFSRSFPRNIEGSVYPRWEEVFLSDGEERNVEDKLKIKNIELMKECLKDAQVILLEKRFDFSHSDVINVAIALFEKRASHVVYAKEEKTKEKFDETFSKK